MTSLAGQMSFEAPDPSLVAAARTGDRAAFSVLVERYRDVIFAYALAVLRHRADAEDVTQETFLRAYRALHRLRTLDSWEAWLMRILRNLCRDNLRRRRVRKTEPIDCAWLEGDASPECLTLAGEDERQ